MPRGPQGQQRPRDVVGAAVAVARIATGEQDEQFETRTAGQTDVRGHVKLTAAQRTAIAKQGAAARWAVHQKEE